MVTKKRPTQKRKKATSSASLKPNHPYLVWILLGAVLLIVWFIRVKLLAIPLERDEGDYAYHGQLILDGVSLHDDLVRKRYPMIFFIYAFIMGIFGQSASGIHTGLLLVNTISVILLYYLGKRLFNQTGGIVAAISFAIFSLSPFSDAFAANREHFVVPFILGGLILLLKAFETSRLLHFFLSGLIFGFAYITKEVSIGFIMMAGIYFLYEHFKDKKLQWRNLFIRGSLFALGVASPVALVFLFYYAGGTFDQFWFRNFVLKKQYATTVSWDVGKDILVTRIKEIVPPVLLLWALAGVGMLILPFRKSEKKLWVFLVAMVLFSAFSVIPGYYFRPHYFILFLPIASLLVGHAFVGLQQIVKNKGVKYLLIGLMAIAVIQPLVANQQYYFEFTANEFSRKRYGYNPFPEAYELGKYIKTNTQKGDRVVVFGSEPEILFYAHRKSSIEAIYMYDLMAENEFASELQDITIKQAEANMPEFCVIVNVDISWLRKDSSDNRIFHWLDNSYAKNFYVDGMIDIFENNTEYIFGPAAASYKPKSKTYIMVLRRLPN